MYAKMLLVCLLVGVSSACDMTGPETDPWDMTVTLSRKDSQVVGVVSAPAFSSSAHLLTEDGASYTVSAQSVWVGFGVLLYPETTVMEMRGEYVWENPLPLLFSERYAARVLLEDINGKKHDISSTIEGDVGVFSYFIPFLPTVREGFAAGLVQISCQEVGEAVLHFPRIDVVQQGGNTTRFSFYFDSATLSITCSREHP